MSTFVCEGSSEEWQDILKSHGWTGTEERLHELCSFLASEGLTWRTIGLLGGPAEWAPQFTKYEAQYLLAIGKKRAKKANVSSQVFSKHLAHVHL